MSKPLEGVYVALTTPFVGDEISTEKLRENVRKLNATGVWPATSSSARPERASP